MQEPWWISTKEFLPDVGERFLVITKTGHIVDCAYRRYGLDTQPSFFDGLIPGKDFFWWMPIPVDGWNDLKQVQPAYGQTAIVMGMYGKVFSGTWSCFSWRSEPEFRPFVFPVFYWHEVPQLPDGIILKGV